MEIYFKDRVVSINKWFLLNMWKFYCMKFPQICKITAANDSIKGKKRGNMDNKFPQSWKISSDSVWTSGSFLMSVCDAQDRTGQVTSEHVKSGQVKSEQVKSGQAKSGTWNSSVALLSPTCIISIQTVGLKCYPSNFLKHQLWLLAYSNILGQILMAWKAKLVCSVNPIQHVY